MMTEISNDVSIVNIGSVVGSCGNAGQTAYSASKSALRGLTKSLAKELGRKDIRVNLVEAGYIDGGGMTADLSTAITDDMRRASCLDRLGTPKDVAEVVQFLASPKSAFVTGQVLRVDGGLAL